MDNRPGKPVLGCDGCQLLKTAGGTGRMFCLTQTQLEAGFLCGLVCLTLVFPQSRLLSHPQKQKLRGEASGLLMTVFPRVWSC